jgi:Holliday junction resolvase RusA-like endonuclease
VRIPRAEETLSWQLFAAFDVHGEPKGQPRPRAFARGGKARVYDPGTAEAWKGDIALAARPFLPTEPIDSPIKVAVSFYFPRPARLLRKKDPDGLIPHTAKPDSDNAAKAVLDALTTIGMWRDDALVSSLIAEKHYAARGQVAGALIQVFVLKEAV